ncbi:MAG: hydroxyacid dehydrogenase [Eubacteriaceae bacterium]
MNFNLLITEPISLKAINILNKNKVKLFRPYLDLEKDKIDAEFIKKYQINGIIVRGQELDKKIISDSKNLKVIIKHGVGYNNIDIETAKNLKILLLYTPCTNTESVAEFTMGLIYLCYKKYIEFNNILKICKNWNQLKYETVELNRKTLGIIGFGKIGKRVHEITSPLNMKTIVYDPFSPSIKNQSIDDKIIIARSLNELLENSDIVTIHCPLTMSTRHMIGEDEFKKMKKDAYLINTARGSIVDERALLKALENYWIAGAAIDTFEIEPLDFSNKLIKLQNLYMTPHIAANAKESFIRTGLLTADLILKVIYNRINEIDKQYYIIR